MARLYSPLTEGYALRTLCSPDENVSLRMASLIDETYFRDKRALDAFNAITEYVDRRGRYPRFRILSESLGVDEKTREYLRAISTSAKTKPEVDELAEKLAEYRKSRMAYDMTKAVMEKLEGSSVKSDDLTEIIGKCLVSLQHNKILDAFMHSTGGNNSSDALVDQLLNRKEEDFYIPTGFKSWDERNAGLPRGSLVTIGGASSAGKSHVIVQMAKIQAQLGYKVVVVPLEMGADEYMARLLSNVCRVDSLRINRNQLTTDEHEYVRKKYARYKRTVEKNGGCLTIFRPDYDVTIEEALAAAHALNPDIIYIDYIGLLKGADGDDQWRKLGQIARHAKVYAGAHQKVVVMAAQVDDVTGRLRYSQAVKEHSSVAWSFVATKASRETGILKFNTFKSRNQEAINFDLKIEYEYATLRDLTSEETQSLLDMQETTDDSDEIARPKKKAPAKAGNVEYDFKSKRPSYQDTYEAIYKRPRKQAHEADDSEEDDTPKALVTMGLKKAKHVVLADQSKSRHSEESSHPERRSAKSVSADAEPTARARRRQVELEEA